MKDQSITASISYKSLSGDYGCVRKTFESEEHLSNYVAKMYRNGQKVIGIHPKE